MRRNGDNGIVDSYHDWHLMSIAQVNKLIKLYNQFVRRVESKVDIHRVHKKVPSLGFGNISASTWPNKKSKVSFKN